MVVRVCKERLEPHLETMLALVVLGALHLAGIGGEGGRGGIASSWRNS